MRKIASLLVLMLVVGTLFALPARQTDAGGSWRVAFPVVVGDVVVTAKGATGVYGLKLSDGSKVWEYQTMDKVYASPTAKDDKVYWVLSQPRVPYRFLTCLKAATGELVWETPLEKASYGRPTIIEDKIYVGTTGFNSGKGTVICYDMDGKKIWEWDKAEGWVMSCPAYSGDTLFVSSNKGRIWTLNKNTGKEMRIWKNPYFETDGPGPNPDNPYKDGGPIETDVVLSSGLLYVGSFDGTTYAVGAGTGTASWRFYDKNIRFMRSSPLLSNGNVYIGAQAVSDKGNGLYALDAISGAKVGYFKTDDYVTGNPVSYGTYVIFTADNGIVYCVDKDAGAAIWKTSVGNIPSCQPFVAGDRVIVTARTSTFGIKVSCLNGSTGAKIWEQE